MKPTNVPAILLWFVLTVVPNLRAQPVPHHLDGIAALPDRTITLSLGGSVSNLIPGLSGTISNQFMQMFDLYAIEASANLRD